MENLINIGHTKKPHGLKGEIKLFIEEKYLEDLLQTDVVLIDIKGKKTPFFVENIRVGNNIIAQFEDINTIDLAMNIASKELYLRVSDLIPDDEREFEVEVNPYAHCVGYTIKNEGVAIGTISEIIEYPQQDMGLINYNNKDLLIPLNEVFIKKLDNKNKLIEMSLPDGLLDL